MQLNWLQLIAERIKTDDAFARELEDISTQNQMERLLKKEGIAYKAEELPGMLAYLEGWRERTHALSDEELEALSGGMVNCGTISPEDRQDEAGC